MKLYFTGWKSLQRLQQYQQGIFSHFWPQVPTLQFLQYARHNESGESAMIAERIQRYDVDQLFFVFFDLEVIYHMQRALLWKILMLDSLILLFLGFISIFFCM